MLFVEGHRRHCYLAVVMVVVKTAACLWIVSDFGLGHWCFVHAASIDVETSMRSLTRRCQEPLEIVSAAKLLAL
jgi:type IV secretory pathway TrbD component